MITIKTAIDEVRKLINQPSVTSLTARIFSGEVPLSEYQSMQSEQSCFVVINALPVSFMQEQKGIVNINIYAPDNNSGLANLKELDNIFLAVKPLVEDGYTELISSDIETVTLLREETIRYSYYNVRLKVFSENI